jgi:hypothetical protein
MPASPVTPDVTPVRMVTSNLTPEQLAANAVKERVCRHRPIARLYRLTYNLLALGSFAWVLAALPTRFSAPWSTPICPPLGWWPTHTAPAQRFLCWW